MQPCKLGSKDVQGAAEILRLGFASGSSGFPLLLTVLLKSTALLLLGFIGSSVSLHILIFFFIKLGVFESK